MSNNEGDSAWSKNDDAEHGDGLVYVLLPSEEIRSKSDYDKAISYKLAVIRNGVTKYLGVSDDKEMVVVTDINDAANFTVYSDTLKRFYISAYGTDYYRYYKINSLEDINSGDELIIAYNRDDGKKVIFSMAYLDSSTGYNSDNNYMYGLIPAQVQVLDEFSTTDSRDATYSEDVAYKYRFDTEEYIKKPFAYMDEDEDTIIWAQGVTANVIGDAKSESKKQRKYSSVTALGDMYSTVYIKPDASYKAIGGYNFNGIAAETNFFPGDNAGEFYIRGGKDTTWLGLGSYQKYALSLVEGKYVLGKEMPMFNTVDKASRIPVEIYKRSTTEESFKVQYHNVDGTLSKTETKPKDTFSLIQKVDAEENGETYIFVGWTTDETKAGYLPLNKSTNLYDYDDLSRTASIKDSVASEYKLLGDCNPEGAGLIDFDDVSELLQDDILDVYPVYAIKGHSAAVTADEDDKMIIGVSDFKDLQMAGDGKPNEKERWLGSINIEVYKDGELWVPGNSTEVPLDVSPMSINRPWMLGRNALNRLASSNTEDTATMYFAYHNDNAADLNIKFIPDTVTSENLYSYMSNGEFTVPVPTGNYQIDAVWAEQGGSEDGLKYRYNWMSSDYGGQLDNVRGGSTVKIYITTKYQVKYYLDKDGLGYKELTGEKWQNPNFYTSPGTDNAVAELESSATDYHVEPDNTYTKLIDSTPNDGTTFVDEKIKRGEYSKFLYSFGEHNYDIPIAELPGDDVLDGMRLRDTTWSMKDVDVQEIETVNPSSTYSITGTVYGTGNTGKSFLGESTPFVNDIANTYHLTLNVISDLSVKKIVESDDENDKKESFTFEITLDDPENEDEDKRVVNGVYGDMTFTNNKATITLKDGETKLAECLPAGMTYTVTEVQKQGFKLKEKTNDTGTIEYGLTKEAEFTNIPAKTHSITVSKSVTGNMGDTSKKFGFVLKLEENEGTSVPETVSAEFTVAGASETKTLTVSGGQVSFELADGDAVVFNEIPENISYQISETDANSGGYETSVEAEQGTVTATTAVVNGTLTDNESVAYTNAYNSAVPTRADGREAGVMILVVAFGYLIIWFLNIRRKRNKLIK